MNAIQRYKGNYLLVLRTKNSAFHGSAYICRLAKLVCQTDNNFAGSVVSLFTLYDTSVYSACTSSYKQWAADVHTPFRNVFFSHHNSSRNYIITWTFTHGLGHLSAIWYWPLEVWQNVILSWEEKNCKKGKGLAVEQCF